MKKETKEVGRELPPGKGSPSREGNFKKRGFQTPGNTFAAESVVSLGSTSKTKKIDRHSCPDSNGQSFLIV